MEGVCHSYNSYVQDDNAYYDSNLSDKYLSDNTACIETIRSYASADTNYSPIVWYRPVDNDYHALADAHY
jgi:hypothetical protein